MINSLSEIVVYLIWWARFLFKTALLSLNIPYPFFQRIGLFRHGEMDDTVYAKNKWALHYNAVCHFGEIDKKSSFLELGPGDSLNSASNAKDEGFKHAVLVDVDAFAIDSSKVLAVLNRGNTTGNSESRDEPSFLCEYLTDGEKSLTGLEDSVTSFVFSNSVLQHIGYDRLDSVLYQLFRITTKGGKQSHVIDLRDMIDRSNLHFQCPFWIWESKFFRKLPIYTNRHNCVSWIKIIRASGFHVLDLKLHSDDGVILESQLAKSDPNRLVSSMHIVLEKK
jgi:hypothetical protein